MSKQEWSELALVGGAAIYNGMSYGFYVAAGMPNLERFKRAVEKGEYAPGKRRETDCHGLRPGNDTGKVKAPRRIDRRGERKKLVCQRCKEAFVAEIKAGPLPKYCPTCKELRRKEQRAITQKAYRERKKEGELLA